MIDNYKIIQLQQNILNKFNKKLNDSANRITYFFLNYANKLHIQKEYTEKMSLICLLHNIGAYKQSNKEEHSNEYINSYMFFKYFTPYSKNAKNLFYSNEKYNPLNSDINYNNGVLLHLFRTLDSMIVNGKTDYQIIEQLKSNKDYSPTSTIIVCDLIKDGMLEKVRDCSYKNELSADLYDIFSFRTNNTHEFLKMVLYTFVYYSEETLTHSQTTALIAKSIGEKMGLNPIDINKLYVGALVHDVGKIDVPVHILENPNELTQEEYEIVKIHVESSKAILSNIFDQDILNMVYHHHERLDGSGYPNGLKADDLNLFDRILSVADTVSAVHEPRCYQQAFTIDQISDILSKLSEQNKLDKNVVDVFLQNKNEIIDECNVVVKNVRNSYRVFEREIDMLYQFEKSKDSNEKEYVKQEDSKNIDKE